MTSKEVKNCEKLDQAPPPPPACPPHGQPNKGGRYPRAGPLVSFSGGKPAGPPATIFSFGGNNNMGGIGSINSGHNPERIEDFNVKPVKGKVSETLLQSGSAMTFDAKFDIERQNQLFGTFTPIEPNPSLRKPSRLLYFEPVSYMDPKLYRSAIAGNFDAFQDIESGSRPYCDKVTPRGNTVLHLAAVFGHNQLVQFLVDRCPDLVGKKNYKGDLALHVAAFGGHLSMLESLLPAINPEGETDINCPLKMVNKKGNTALHIALENRHKEVAEFLAEKDVTVSNYKNSEGKSPLCLSAEAGYTELVKLIMAKKCVWGKKNSFDEEEKKEEEENDDDEEEENEEEKNEQDIEKEEFEEGKSLVHAAIMGRNRDVLEALCYDEDALIKLSLRDEEGRTALSFAAYKGYLDVVRFLLDKSTEIAYVMDQNGFFPIHMASRKGHIEIVHEFLHRCPDSRELLVDVHCQNILHVAAMYGKAKMVTYMLKTQELEMLINERDRGGNTPLHYATEHWQPKVVSILTWDKRVRLDAINDEGMTAMDVAKNNMETMAPFRKRLTVTALKSANVPSYKKMSRNRETQKVSSTLVEPPNIDQYKDRRNRETQKVSSTSVEPPNIDQYKDRINTLVLVSTIVATVTFAAGFTMPGGNNDSGQDGGIATLVTRPAFYTFLICNTIAMYSSIIVVISLIFAQLADLNLILTALRVALPFLGLAVMTMSSAFMAGTYLVVSNHNLLAISVLILDSIFFIILLALFILLYSPTSSHNYIARYAFYYPFCWMIFVSRSDVDRKKRVIFTDWK